MFKSKPYEFQLFGIEHSQEAVKPPVSDILLRTKIVEQTRSEIGVKSRLQTEFDAEMTEQEKQEKIERLKKKQLFMEFCADTSQVAGQLLQSEKYAELAPCFTCNERQEIVALNCFIQKTDDLMIGAVAGSAHFSELRKINLNDGEITDESMQILSESGLLKKVNHISLICTGVTAKGLSYLFNCPEISRLRSLI